MDELQEVKEFIKSRIETIEELLEFLKKEEIINKLPKGLFMSTVSLRADIRQQARKMIFDRVKPELKILFDHMPDIKEIAFTAPDTNKPIELNHIVISEKYKKGIK